MQDMYRITYISKNALDGDHDDVTAQLQSILASATKNNPELDITGALLYSGGYFCQVIEGEQDKIEDLFETIQMDSRHSDVTVLNFEPCESRIFGEWAMAFAGINNDMRVDLDGVKNSLDEVLLKETGSQILHILNDLVVKKQAEL